VDNWESAEFGKLQALPTGGKPVTLWADRDSALADVAKGIREEAAGSTAIREAALAKYSHSELR
jgi:hypothetical protein